MVGSVNDMKLIGTISTERPGVVKLPRFATSRAPNADRLAIEGELLNSVIAVFANKDVPLAVEDQVVGIA